MSKTLHFTTDSKISFSGIIVETPRGLAIQAKDLTIPKDFERVYFKVNEITYSFEVARTDIIGRNFHVLLRRSSMMQTRKDFNPFDDENLDLSQELTFETLHQ